MIRRKSNEYGFIISVTYIRVLFEICNSVCGYWRTLCRFLMNHFTVSCTAASNSVKWKFGSKDRSLALDAVFLYWPSALVVSKTSLPRNPKAAAIDSATREMDTSSLSSTRLKQKRTQINRLIPNDYQHSLHTYPTE